MDHCTMHGVTKIGCFARETPLCYQVKVFFFLSLWPSNLPFPLTSLFSLISSLGRVSEELKWDHFEKLWSWLPSSFFSCCTTPNKNSLSSARVFWSIVPDYNPSRHGSHGDRNLGRGSRCIHSREAESKESMLLLTSLPPLI